MKSFLRYVSFDKKVLDSWKLYRILKGRYKCGVSNLLLRILLQMLMEVESWREALDYCKLIVPVYQSMSAFIWNITLLLDAGSFINTFSFGHLRNP